MEFEAAKSEKMIKFNVNDRERQTLIRWILRDSSYDLEGLQIGIKYLYNVSVVVEFVENLNEPLAASFCTSRINWRVRADKNTVLPG